MNKLHMGNNFVIKIRNKLIIAEAMRFQLSAVPHWENTGFVGYAVGAGPVARVGNCLCASNKEVAYKETRLKK